MYLTYVLYMYKSLSKYLHKKRDSIVYNKILNVQPTIDIHKFKYKMGRIYLSYPVNYDYSKFIIFILI
jgi:hypothetical protein